MKTLQDLLNQDPVYLHDFTNKFDVISNFENVLMTQEEYEASQPPYKNVDRWIEKKNQMKVHLENWKDINILFAVYTYIEYAGDAFVLFEQNGKLYEVNGSHCSCYGLEGQWEPEETNLEAIKYRLTEGKMGNDYWSGDTYNTELKKFLGI